MKFELPEPTQSTSAPVETVLKSRRSIREFSDKAASMEQLSQLLWAAQGISGEDGKKTAPSAGAQYPLQIYSVLESRDLELGEALPHEASLAADAKRLEAADGAGRFARGAGRHGGNS